MLDFAVNFLFFFKFAMRFVEIFVLFVCLFVCRKTIGIDKTASCTHVRSTRVEEGFD